MEEVNELIKKVSNYYKKKGKPEAEHTIGYDSAAEGLEPIYFFITDLMNDFGLKTEKIVDNFTSSPGSGHFGELGQRATAMQQQGAKILGDINAVLRSVLNLIYDLKDFKMRLHQYGGLKSKNKLIKDASILSLKQIWMDKVDILKGNSSIKSMALGQAGFSTLINAFLSVSDEKDVDRLDINDIVKRITKPRIQEFNIWLEQSEKELSKRYELEKNYLRSQVNSLKLYSRWAKPYLKAAQQLEQKESGRNVDLVKTFNTIILELTLFGKSKFDIKSAALSGDLPQEFAREKFLKRQKRNYHVCVLVDFYFRGIPQRVSAQQAHYSFGGKTKITFRSYVLSDEELEKLNKELSKSDLDDVFRLIEGATTESLGVLQEEIDSFLDEKETEEISKEKKKSNEVNPFLALIGKYENKPEKKEDGLNATSKKDKSEKPIKKESWIESALIRPLVAKKAQGMAFNLFNTYKKAHGMASYI